MLFLREPTRNTEHFGGRALTVWRFELNEWLRQLVNCDSSFSFTNRLNNPFTISRLEKNLNFIALVHLPLMILQKTGEMGSVLNIGSFVRYMKLKAKSALSVLV